MASLKYMLGRLIEFIDIFAYSQVGWSERGCHVKSMDDSYTECTCNHLTHFAVLMQFDTEAGQGYDTISVVRSITKKAFA